MGDELKNNFSRQYSSINEKSIEKKLNHENNNKLLHNQDNDINKTKLNKDHENLDINV